MGISQTELSRRSKISLTTINELESRAFRDIRLSTIVSLSEVLKIPVINLFSSSDLDFVIPSDQAQLLKASEALFQITKKLRSKPKQR